MFLRAITAHTIWQIPMKTSQTPATTASTAIESKGQAITTMAGHHVDDEEENVPAAPR
jgi:hypothetical protein